MNKDQVKSLVSKIISGVIIICTIGFSVFFLLLAFMYFL